MQAFSTTFAACLKTKNARRGDDDVEKEPSLKKNRVLIVDDEEASTLLLQKVIEKDGYIVDVANSA